MENGDWVGNHGKGAPDRENGACKGLKRYIRQEFI